MVQIGDEIQRAYLRTKARYMRQMVKPTIRLYEGWREGLMRYECKDNELCGLGMTASEAYNAWRAKAIARGDLKAVFTSYLPPAGDFVEYLRPRAIKAPWVSDRARTF